MGLSKTQRKPKSNMSFKYNDLCFFPEILHFQCLGAEERGGMFFFDGQGTASGWWAWGLFNGPHEIMKP